MAIIAGEPNVDRLKDSIPYPMFMEWRAFFARDPQGEYRADLRNALLIHRMRQTLGDSKSRLEDHILFPPDEHRAQSPEEQQRIMQAIWGAIGGN